MSTSLILVYIMEKILKPENGFVMLSVKDRRVFVWQACAVSNIRCKHSVVYRRAAAESENRCNMHLIFVYTTLQTKNVSPSS